MVLWKRRLALGLIVLVLPPALQACSGDDGGGLVAGVDEPASTAVTTSASATSDTSTPRSTTSTNSPRPSLEQASVLLRRDAPPGGIEAQASFYGGGASDSSCLDTIEGPFPSPTIAVPGATLTDVSSGEMPIGIPSYICLFEFSTGPVELTIEGPSGWKRRESICFKCNGLTTSTKWQRLPGDPHGRYNVKAAQGAASGTGVISVVRHPTPLLVVTESPGRDVPSVAAGSAVHIGLAGFAARETVHVDIYHGADDRSSGTYITSLTLKVEGNGQLLHTLKTGAGDARGCYSMHPRPAVELGTTWALTSMNGFCLR